MAKKPGMDILDVMDTVLVSPLVPDKDGQLLPLTPQLAEEFDRMSRWKGERDLNPSRMAYLLTSMNVVALPFVWITVTIAELLYRMNGQHSSRLFCERPALIRPGMIVHRVNYSCDTLEQISKLYGTIDARASARTISEVNRSFSQGHPRLDKHTRSFINLCSTGIRTATRGITDRSSLSVVELGELLLGHLDFIDFVAEILPKKTSTASHLWRSPVLYALYRTWEVDADAAKKFWILVRDGDHPRDTPPDMLRDYLKATTLGGGHGGSARSSRINSRGIMAEKLIRGWNAWREDRSLRIIPGRGNIPKPI